MFSGKQKHRLEIHVRDVLQLISPHIDQSKLNFFTNMIVTPFVNQESNLGDIGIIRGYLRRARDRYSIVNDGQRVPKDGDRVVYSVLQEVLGATKILMNGNNILKTPICKFEDKEENFYCTKEVGWGFDYCYDHWQIIKEREANGA